MYVLPGTPLKYFSVVLVFELSILHVIKKHCITSPVLASPFAVSVSMEKANYVAVCDIKWNAHMLTSHRNAVIFLFEQVLVTIVLALVIGALYFKLEYNVAGIQNR